MAKTYTPAINDVVFFSTPTRGGKVTQRIGVITGGREAGFYLIEELSIGGAPTRDLLVRASAITGKAPKTAQRAYQGGMFVPAAKTLTDDARLAA